MISVIIPAYDARDELQFSLGSILSQHFEDWECIVVDDGSRLPLDDLVEAADDRRVRLVRHEHNRGRGAARRTGLEAARGEYIAWQDADDWSMPKRLLVQAELLERQKTTAFVGTGMIIADHEDRCVGVRHHRDSPPRRLRPLEQPRVGHPTLMFRRSVLERFNYRKRFHTSEDHDFLARALAHFEFANLAEPLYCYREYQSQSAEKYWESTKTRLAVVREQLGEYPLRGLLRSAIYLGKAVVYTGFAAVGAEEILLRRRSEPIDGATTRRYEEARRALHELVEERFEGGS